VDGMTTLFGTFNPQHLTLREVVAIMINDGCTFDRMENGMMVWKRYVDLGQNFCWVDRSLGVDKWKIGINPLDGQPYPWIKHDTAIVKEQST
jgi:hypothetical protein